MPVVFQDFENDMAEYAFLQADNAIALWAELDLSGINADIPDFDPDFDIDLLGIKNFTVDISEKIIEDTSKELNLDDFDDFQHQCPKCGFEWNDNGTTDGNDEL